MYVRRLLLDMDYWSMATRAVEAVEDTVRDVLQRVRRVPGEEEQDLGDVVPGELSAPTEHQSARPEQPMDGTAPAASPSWSEGAAHGDGRSRHPGKKMHCTKKSLLFHFSAEFLKNDSASRYGEIVLCAPRPFPLAALCPRVHCSLVRVLVNALHCANMATQ